MAIGEWTDGRAFWFFQALVESSKLDAGEENAYNLLVQGPSINFPTLIAGRWVGTTVDASSFGDMALSLVNGVIGFGKNGLGINAFYAQEVGLKLYDRCPWNRIFFGVFVNSMTNGSAGTAAVRLYRRPVTAPRTRVLLYELLVAGFAAAGWYSTVIDITGLSVGETSFMFEAQAHSDAGAANVQFGSPFIQLASSIAGV